MAKSLMQIQDQIEKLQKEADTLRNSEKKGVIARIKEAINTYGFTADDLGLSSTSTSAVKRRATKAASASGGKYKTPIRFRDSAGNEWSGHGRRPRWFLAAVAGGTKPEEMAV